MSPEVAALVYGVLLPCACVFAFDTTFDGNFWSGLELYAGSGKNGKKQEYGERVQWERALRTPLNSYSNAAFSAAGVWVWYAIKEAPNPCDRLTPWLPYAFCASLFGVGLVSFLFHASYAERYRFLDASATMFVSTAPLITTLLRTALALGAENICAGGFSLAYVGMTVFICILAQTPGWSTPVLVAQVVPVVAFEVFIVGTPRPMLKLGAVASLIGGMQIRLVDIRWHHKHQFAWLGHTAWHCLSALGATMLFISSYHQDPMDDPASWTLAKECTVALSRDGVPGFSILYAPATPSSAGTDVWLLLCALCIVIPTRLLLRELGGWAIRLSGSPMHEDQRVRCMLEQTVWHAGMGIWALKACTTQPFWHGGVDRFFDNDELLPMPMTGDVRVYYALGFAYSLHDLGVSLTRVLVAGERITDFQMFAHHIAFVGLMGLSYTASYFRIGMTVLMLHDISDVPVDLMRLFNTLNWDTGAAVMWVSSVVMWLVCRLIVYPFTCVIPTITRSWPSPLLYDPTNPVHVANRSWLSRRFGGVNLFILWALFAGMLSALFVMHVIWFGAILNKGLRQLGMGSIREALVVFGKKLARHARSPLAPAMLVFLYAINMFVGFLSTPNTAMMLACAAVRGPRGAYIAGIAASTGVVLGSAGWIHLFRPWIMGNDSPFTPHAPVPGAYAVPATIMLCASPLPLQPLIAGFLLAHMKTTTILACVFVGRLIHYCCMSQLLAVATALFTTPSKYWVRYICSGSERGNGNARMQQTV